MNKQLRRIAALGLTLAAGFGTVYSQQSIEGYFRVQSALGGADQSGYVEVRGPFTTAPDLTLGESLTNAGTVMRLRAFTQKYNGQTRYKIANLSSQGIEVFGKPRADYMDAAIEIAGYIDTNDYVGSAYAVQRQARQIGYIASGRAIIEALFTIVARRLDSEIARLPQETKDKLGVAGNESLEDFAIRFNSAVSDNIDLFAYLEPVEGKEGQFRLYFNWIDCTEVSKFYLANEQNKKSFEIGFECMRQYMNGKSGLSSGEMIDASEYELWKSWGYDLNANYSDCYDSESGVYKLTYEKIFADHEVLYNWIKMYVERMLDPEKAPDASVLGINFKAFAQEMQRHEIMQGFLQYIPSIQEGQKLYLTSGRFMENGRFSTMGTASDGAQKFGLIDESLVASAGDAAIWNVIKIDENTDNFFAIDPVAHRENKPDTEEAHFAALYFDFPIEAINNNVAFYNIPESNTMGQTSLTNLGSVSYVDMTTSETKVERLTPMLVSTKTTDIYDNKVRIPYEAQTSDYKPNTDDVTTEQKNPIVSDEAVDNQRVIRRAGDMGAENASAYAVLLRTPADDKTLQNMWGIDANLAGGNSVYDLTTREDKKSAQTKQSMRTPWYLATESIPANHAFLLAPTRNSDGSKVNGISLGAPADEMPPIPTGIEAVEVENQLPDTIYDLQGRPVNEVYPGGIYILNGKKIFVK